MTESETYVSAAAVDRAISDAARVAFKVDRSLSVQARVKQEYFRRFLSRVFSAGPESDWMLKGGTGILARAASARSTLDVDLFRARQTIDGALADLKRLALVDLGDFFRFLYRKHEPVVAGEEQDYTEGYRVTFDVYVGADQKEPLHVDLVVGVIVTDEATVAAPANALNLPKLRSHDYRSAADLTFSESPSRGNRGLPGTRWGRTRCSSHRPALVGYRRGSPRQPALLVEMVQQRGGVSEFPPQVQ